LPAAFSEGHAFAKESDNFCSDKNNVYEHPMGSSAPSGEQSSAMERDDDLVVHDYADNKFTNPFVFTSVGSGTEVHADPARVLSVKSCEAASSVGLSTVARAICSASTKLASPDKDGPVVTSTKEDHSGEPVVSFADRRTESPFDDFASIGDASVSDPERDVLSYRVPYTSDSQGKLSKHRFGLPDIHMYWDTELHCDIIFPEMHPAVGCRSEKARWCYPCLFDAGQSRSDAERAILDAKFLAQEFG